MDDRKRTRPHEYSRAELAPDSDNTLRANVEAIEGPASSRLHVDDLLEAVRALDTAPKPKPAPQVRASKPPPTNLPRLNHEDFQPVEQTVRMSREDAMRMAEAPRQDSTAIMSRADAMRMAEAHPSPPAAPAPALSRPPAAPAAPIAPVAPAVVAPTAKPSRKLQALAIALGIATLASILTTAFFAMRRH